MHITKMTPQDLPRIDEIQRRAYPDELIEPLHVLDRRRSLAEEFCLTANVDNAVAGYLIAHPWSPDSSPGLHADLDALPHDASVIHLHDLAIDPDYRGQRLAHHLVDALLHKAQEHHFSELTLVAVADARPFWERLGFTAQHPAAGYDPGAVFMVRGVV